MHPRIRELAKQAKLNLDELPDHIFIPLEHFAELLIRDSASHVNHLFKQGGGTHGETITTAYNLPPPTRK
jgi:hypothetical protein